MTLRVTVIDRVVGPMEAATKRGFASVQYSSAASRAIRAAARLISTVASCKLELGHGQRVAVERVGLDDLRSGIEILLVNRGDKIRPGPANVVRAVLQVRAAVVGDRKLRMQNAPHRAVHYDNAGSEGVMKRLLAELSIFHGFMRRCGLIILTSCMHEAADNLQTNVTDARERLREISESEASAPLKAGGWSAKQVIGHLIDSACNNHQRFVRLALSRGLVSPGYEQAEWVNLQDYASRRWIDLLALWTSYNRHLAHVIAAIPAESLANQGTVTGSPVTLQFLMEDYVAHLEHHLRTSSGDDGDLVTPLAFRCLIG